MASRRTELRAAAIVPDARQPFFGEMAHAVEQAAAERGKMVLVGNSDYIAEREVHYLRAFLGMRVSGLILVSHALNDNAAAEIDAWDARAVLPHQRPKAIHDVAVVTDDVGGAQLATRHLLEHGYEIRGLPRRHRGDPDRRRPGLRPRRGLAARDAGGRDPHQGRLFEAPYNRYDAYQVGLQLLERSRPPARHLRPPTTRPSACCAPRVSCASMFRDSWPWPVSTTSRKPR